MMIRTWIQRTLFPTVCTSFEGNPHQPPISALPGKRLRSPAVTKAGEDARAQPGVEQTLEAA
jgi:hypothetical protein